MHQAINMCILRMWSWSWIINWIFSAFSYWWTGSVCSNSSGSFFQEYSLPSSIPEFTGPTVQSVLDTLQAKSVLIFEVIIIYIVLTFAMTFHAAFGPYDIEYNNYGDSLYVEHEYHKEIWYDDKAFWNFFRNFKRLCHHFKFLCEERQKFQELWNFESEEILKGFDIISNFLFYTKLFYLNEMIRKLQFEYNNDDKDFLKWNFQVFKYLCVLSFKLSL